MSCISPTPNTFSTHSLLSNIIRMFIQIQRVRLAMVYHVIDLIHSLLLTISLLCRIADFECVSFCFLLRSHNVRQPRKRHATTSYRLHGLVPSTISPRRLQLYIFLDTMLIGEMIRFSTIAALISVVWRLMFFFFWWLEMVAFSGLTSPVDRRPKRFLTLDSSENVRCLIICLMRYSVRLVRVKGSV